MSDLRTEIEVLEYQSAALWRDARDVQKLAEQFSEPPSIDGREYLCAVLGGIERDLRDAMAIVRATRLRLMLPLTEAAE